MTRCRSPTRASPPRSTRSGPGSRRPAAGPRRSAPRARDARSSRGGPCRRRGGRRATEAGVAAQRHEAMCATLAVDEAERRAGRGSGAPSRPVVQLAASASEAPALAASGRAATTTPIRATRRPASAGRRRGRDSRRLLQAPLASRSARPAVAGCPGRGRRGKARCTYQQDRAHAGNLPSAARAAGPCPRPIISAPAASPQRGAMRTLSQIRKPQHA
jgi:hypothetical protein